MTTSQYTVERDGLAGHGARRSGAHGVGVEETSPCSCGTTEAVALGPYRGLDGDEAVGNASADHHRLELTHSLNAEPN